MTSTAWHRVFAGTSTRSRIVSATIALVVAWGGLTHSVARAVDKPIASLPPLDDDFPLQGDYAGHVRSAAGRLQWTGLQIIALGNGEFQGVEYIGGLPGNGGTIADPEKYSGKRSGGTVELTGGNRRITVEQNRAVVRDSAGRDLGRLRKYHRLSKTLRLPPPSGATVLFDGANTDRLTGATVTSDQLLNVGFDTKQTVTDFTLHAEFRTPYMPDARGQSRGNSGIYIQGRYEVQILDSFGLEGAFNECGALYRTQPPMLNMCFPPMSWQTYDIDFTAARFDSTGNKTTPAKITVRLNGVVVQKDYAIPNKTGAGAAEGADPRPIKFQNHRDAVNFRNIWIVDRSSGSVSEPCCGTAILPVGFTTTGDSGLIGRGCP
ncbi:MAG TPA: DUF1080 domain-containing protein [Planctomycetaceae bacterium]|jgi:hypothetical protein|nr:DUF1080 domain-containing protein [Planctomycetaceae bacterium]